MKKILSLTLGVALAIAGLAAPVAAWHASSPSCEKLDLGQWTADVYVNTQKVKNNVTGVISIAAGTYFIDWENSHETDVVTVAVCPIIKEVPVEVIVEVPVEVIKEVPVDRIVEKEVIREVPVDRVVERIVTPRIYAPQASATVCGDPRAIITLDNSISNVPVTFKVTYLSGKDGTRIVKFKTVQAGAIEVTEPTWVKGGGALLRVRGQNLEPLLVLPVYRGAEPCAR